jgi:hypothetical protein
MPLVHTISATGRRCKKKTPDREKIPNALAEKSVKERLLPQVHHPPKDQISASKSH